MQTSSFPENSHSPHHRNNKLILLLLPRGKSGKHGTIAPLCSRLLDSRVQVYINDLLATYVQPFRYRQ